MMKFKPGSDKPGSMRTEDILVVVDECGDLPDSFGDDFESFAASRSKLWKDRVIFRKSTDCDCEEGPIPNQSRTGDTGEGEPG